MTAVLLLKMAVGLGVQNGVSEVNRELIALLVQYRINIFCKVVILGRGVFCVQEVGYCCVNVDVCSFGECCLIGCEIVEKSA